MSEVSVFIPDDGWFKPGCGVFPEDKQLCVVIHKYGKQTPAIYQFRKADFLYSKSDYFLDVTEKWELDSMGFPDDWEPGFATFDIISQWKPLGLPADVNERIQMEIEKWFEDDYMP